MNDHHYQLLLHELVELRAELQVLRETNATLLKVLVAFPTGQTPQRWMAERLQRSYDEHYGRISGLLGRIDTSGAPVAQGAVAAAAERPRGADSSQAPFAFLPSRREA